jgi:hypothetical protein
MFVSRCQNGSERRRYCIIPHLISPDVEQGLNPDLHLFPSCLVVFLDAGVVVVGGPEGVVSRVDDVVEHDVVVVVCGKK